LRELLGEAACIREVKWWTGPQRDKKVKAGVFGRETKHGDMVRKVYMRLHFTCDEMICSGVNCQLLTAQFP
jgi:hypothetical protein